MRPLKKSSYSGATSEGRNGDGSIVLGNIGQENRPSVSDNGKVKIGVTPIIGADIELGIVDE